MTPPPPPDSKEQAAIDAGFVERQISLHEQLRENQAVIDDIMRKLTKDNRAQLRFAFACGGLFGVGLALVVESIGRMML